MRGEREMTFMAMSQNVRVADTVGFQEGMCRCRIGLVV